MNNKTVVPLTTPPKKKLHIGIKIGIVFAISFLLFIIRTILIFTGWDGASLVGALLGIALPIFLKKLTCQNFRKKINFILMKKKN